MSSKGIFHVAGLHFGEGNVVLLADAAGASASQPRGERNFSFRDPEGYDWSCGEIRGV
jgi:hypothetical protein